MSDIAEARFAAKKIAAQLSAGTGHVVDLAPGEVADYHAATKILRTLPGISLSSACQQFSDAVLKIGNNGTLGDAVECFLKQAGKNKLPAADVPTVINELHRRETEIRRSYVPPLEKLTPRFEAGFRCGIGHITTADHQAFIDNIEQPSRKEIFFAGLSSQSGTSQNIAVMLAGIGGSKLTILKRSNACNGAVGMYTPLRR